MPAGHRGHREGPEARDHWTVLRWQFPAYQYLDPFHPVFCLPSQWSPFSRLPPGASWQLVLQPSCLLPGTRKANWGLPSSRWTSFLFPRSPTWLFHLYFDQNLATRPYLVTREFENYSFSPLGWMTGYLLMPNKIKILLKMKREIDLVVSPLSLNMHLH